VTANNTYVNTMTMKGPKVGIGTTSPATKLHIRRDESDAENLMLRLQDAAGNTVGDRIGIEGYWNTVPAGDIEFEMTNSSNGASAIVFSPHSSGGTKNEAMRIASNGYVGIGQTSPDRWLHITTQGSSGGEFALVLDRPNQLATAAVGIDFQMGDSVSTTAQHSYAHLFGIIEDPANGNEDGALAFWTSLAGTVAEKMRITSDGKVGIGDTTPAEKLQVAGNIRVNNNASIKADGSGYLQLGNTSGGLIRLLGDGGISRIRGEANHLQIETNRDADNIIFAVNAGGTDSDETVVEAMRIVGSNGRIGINQSSPEAELHVEGSLAVAYALAHAGQTGQNRLIFGNNTQTYQTAGTDRLTIAADGAVTVAGAFAAATKEFVIEHPTKPNMKLHHGSLEGPEHAVYIRGKNNSGTIHLPDYWEGLVDEDSITVQLTAIENPQELFVRSISNGKVRVAAKSRGKHLEYFYFIQAERKDVDKLEVEECLE